MTSPRLNESEFESDDEISMNKPMKIGKHLYMTYKIGDHKYNMMLDNGSSYCVMNEELLKTIEANHPNLSLTTLKTLYVIQLPITITDINGNDYNIRFPVRVVKELNVNLLVGLEVLEVLYGVIVDHKYRMADFQLNPKDDTELTRFQAYTLLEIQCQESLTCFVPTENKIDQTVREEIEKYASRSELDDKIVSKFKQILFDVASSFENKINGCCYSKYGLIMDLKMPTMDPKERSFPTAIDNLPYKEK